MNEYWGYHLILNCSGCSNNISDKNEIIKFVKTLVKKIDMIAYGEPIVEHFATHDPQKGGYSLIQLIETSNISGHFVDFTKEAFIDVFSCKEYKEQDVIDCVSEFFDPESIEYSMINRKAP